MFLCTNMYLHEFEKLNSPGATLKYNMHPNSNTFKNTAVKCTTVIRGLCKVFFLLFFSLLISSVIELERTQMSDFSDGHNQDAIITMLITIRRRKRKGEGRKKWFNDFLQERTDCSPSSQLRSIVECARLLTQTLKHMCAWTHTGTAQYQRHRGLTAASSKLERINLVGKWSLIGDRNQATACICKWVS